MVLLALLSHPLSLTPRRTKAIDAQPSTVAYIAKSLAHVGKGEKDMAYLACDMAFEHSHSSHIPLPFPIKVCIPALGLRSSFNCQSILGYRHVYGRRTPRCAILHGWPRCCSSIRLNVPYDSGTCTMCYRVTDITTDVSQRLTCMFSLGNCTRSARNTSMPYGYSSVHAREYSMVRIDCLWWSHW